MGPCRLQTHPNCRHRKRTVNCPPVKKLPAYGIKDLVNEKLDQTGAVVVTAPPGAGKSTVLPLTILEHTPAGRILMVEPRRIAARQVAERMAWNLGENCGETVGYRVRFESKVSSKTRIEVLTEGILTRMLVDDPTLEGVSVVIFDEFHERSLDSDVALALTRESIDLIRPDLKLVIMSATIDAESICRELGAPLVESTGRMFSVQIIHENLLSADASSITPADTAEAAVKTIRKAHSAHEGDILVFLPGEAEIRRCQEMLEGSLGSTRIFPLYGLLDFRQQQAAIAPSLPGERKVVLATPVAETSLTIEGVRIVVDSGLCRKPVWLPQNGLSRLETVRISRDMAEQRKGRAGRVAEGVCYRLWSQAIELRMDECRIPEIQEADLSSMLLDIAAWGEGEVENLKWLTPPPAQNIAQSRRLLQLLDAIDENGNITKHGRQLAAIPCHPRIAGMLLKAKEKGLAALATDLAAILEEKDPLNDCITVDIYERICSLRSARKSRQWSRIARISEQYRRIARCDEDDSRPDSFAIGALLAAAYPERIAKQQDGIGNYLLASGEKACVDQADGITAYEWIVAGNLNTRLGGVGRIFLASPVDPHDLQDYTRVRDNISWDSKTGRVVAQRESRIGRLLLEAKQVSDLGREDIIKVICEAATKDGLSMFNFDEDAANLQRRIQAAALWHPELELPDVATDAILSHASEWLPLYIGKASSASELKKIDISQVIWGLLDYQQQTTVEKIVPSHIPVPTGSRIRLEYRLGAEAPVLRVRLQECFGLLDTPTVDEGRRPVLMELLSPGFKPVQLTKDLRSFWQETYFEVRKELRRRYPKHSWPDNPLEAEAVRGVKKVN